MKTYYIKNDRSMILGIDFSSMTLEEYSPFSPSEPAESKPEEHIEVAEVPRRKKQAQRGSLTPEEKKEKQRKYMAEYHAKKRAGQLPKSDLIIKAKEDIEEKGIPLHLVQEYGMTAVEVVLAEKNRGVVGATATEIFDERDKRLKGLTLFDISKIVDDLEAEGL